MKGIKILKWTFWILACSCLIAIEVIYDYKAGLLGAGVMLGSSLWMSMKLLINVLESDD